MGQHTNRRIEKSVIINFSKRRITFPSKRIFRRNNDVDRIYVKKAMVLVRSTVKEKPTRKRSLEEPQL